MKEIEYLVKEMPMLKHYNIVEEVQNVLNVYGMQGWIYCGILYNLAVFYRERK